VSDNWFSDWMVWRHTDEARRWVESYSPQVLLDGKPLPVTHVRFRIADEPTYTGADARFLRELGISPR
jgi:hypothetical protein